jgi:uncharacterized protein
MSEDYSDTKSSRKRIWSGVRLGFLIAGAIGLLVFGIDFGISLDLATRPKPLPLAASLPELKPLRQIFKAKIEIPPSAEVYPKDSILNARPEARDSLLPSHVPIEQALSANAMARSSPAGQTAIAIVIDDIGLDRTRARKMIEMKGPLTLSLMTYADGLPGLVSQARNGGHEIMAHLPMEPIDPKENPGPGALKISMDDAAIRSTIAADLDGWGGYVGVNNHMGSKFTKDAARMAVVMAELKARGLLWLDSKTIGDTAGPAAAKAVGVPYVERDVFLDNVKTVDAVTAQLEQLAATANAHGSAIGIGHPNDATIAALRSGCRL